MTHDTSTQSSGLSLRSSLGVRLRGTARLVYVTPPGDMARPPETGDWVLVERAGTPDAARVVLPLCQVEAAGLSEPPWTMVRFLRPAEVGAMAEAEVAATGARAAAQARLTAHGVAGRVVDIQTAYDGSHLTIFLAAAGLVDAGPLARELAAHFGVPVTLCPVAAPEAAPAVGGPGRARPVPCCVTELDDLTGHPCQPLRGHLAGTPDQLVALHSPWPCLNTLVLTDQGPARVARVETRRRLATVVIVATGAAIDLQVEELRPAPAGEV